MINAADLTELVSYEFFMHAERAKKPSKAVRKWDGVTPYGVHPAWCAMTLLHETALSEELRVRGAAALLFHDLLEDTTAGIPESLGCPEGARELVAGMTFESSDVEMAEVWSRSEEVKLFKLYDKVSNLLDGAWMSPEKRAKYAAYTLRLAEDVERNFGGLNIVRIARAICG